MWVGTSKIVGGSWALIISAISFRFSKSIFSRFLSSKYKDFSIQTINLLSYSHIIIVLQEMLVTRIESNHDIAICFFWSSLNAFARKNSINSAYVEYLNKLVFCQLELFYYDNLVRILGTAINWRIDFLLYFSLVSNKSWTVVDISLVDIIFYIAGIY